MLKARNRRLSMILVLAMLMTMFAGLGTASAASAVTYSSVNAPVVKTSSSEQNIGAQILINVDDAIVFNKAYDSMVTIQLPSNVELGTTSVTGTGDLAGKVTATKKSSRVLDLSVTAGSYDDSAKILLTFDTLKVKSGTGDVVANFLAPSGSPFPNGEVTLARIATGGKVGILAGSVKNIGDAKTNIDTITLAEATAGVLEKDEVIKFELSKGFEWVEKPTVAGGWGFDGLVSPTAFEVTKMDDRVMEVTIKDALGKTTAGRISVGTDLLTGMKFAAIQATDEAKEGEVTVTVSSDNISKTKIVVANYGSYDVKVEEGTTEEVLAGRTDQEIGKFVIKEAIAGSLIKDRTIILDLPSGVKWVEYPTIEIESGSDVFDTNTFSEVSGSKERSAKITIKDSSTSASKIVLKNAEVKVDPGFEGDIEVTVRGTAGVEGTVKVAEAKTPITIKAENATRIITGAANQKVANIIIQENKDEAILDDAGNNMIVVGLENGYRFTSKPNVAVTDGDLEIDSSKLINDDTELRIIVKYASNEASTITISDVYVTAYRYVPEGNVKATLVAAGNWAGDRTGSTALVNFNSDKSAGSVVIATCATPAEGAGVAEFKIGSNIYYVGGVAKVMDVAPYIKGDRSYVPMRYVAEMLGAEVVWDDAARTVTLTKADDVVVFTIGSAAYTVNGEAMNADVAPEIASERTMLPARYVAEAFGAIVGWDAGTQTVLVQQ